MDRRNRAVELRLIIPVLIGVGLVAGPTPSHKAPSASPDNTQAKNVQEPASDEAAPATRNGVIVPISAEITDVTFDSIKRRVEQAKEQGANVIIFEIDTPGGYVTSALKICDYIKNLHDVRTVAWINTQAYSAGSMIAVACDEIVMARASVLGDCGVILGGPTGPQEVPEAIRAKAESPVLEQFRDSAVRNGYDVLLCESMVVKEYEVWWVENIKTGERRFVDTESMDKLLGTGEKTKILGVEVPSLISDEPAWRLVESFEDPITNAETPVDQPVVKDTELLTMSQSRAYAFGFSKAIVTSANDLRGRYGLTGDMARVDFTWSEVLTRWLTSMPVRMFLLIVIFLGIYVEFNTPGVGVPGLVALIALGIFLAAPFLTGLASFWELLAIILGLILIGVEIFVIPGFGVAGISGIVLFLVGVLATFIPDEPGRFPFQWPSFAPGLEGLKTGVQTLAASIMVSIAGMVLLSRYLSRVPYVGGIIADNPTPSDVLIRDPYDGVARVGDFGTVVGQLRPSGKARFGSKLVDVVSQGDLINEGEQVEVVERRGNRVVVRRVSNA
jgi:membrane-bound serine protease (ClpP class)